MHRLFSPMLHNIVCRLSFPPRINYFHPATLVKSRNFHPESAHFPPNIPTKNTTLIIYSCNIWQKNSLVYASVCVHPLNTWRNYNVVITSKRRHFDVVTSKWRRFYVITTSLLRNVSHKPGSGNPWIHCPPSSPTPHHHPHPHPHPPIIHRMKTPACSWLNSE